MEDHRLPSNDWRNQFKILTKHLLPGGGVRKKLFTLSNVAKKQRGKTAKQDRGLEWRCLWGSRWSTCSCLPQPPSLCWRCFFFFFWFLTSESQIPVPVGRLLHLLVPLQMSSSRCRPTQSRLVAADDVFNRPVRFRTGVFYCFLFTLRSLLYVFVLLALHLLSSCCQGRDNTHRQHTSDGTDRAHIMGCINTGRRGSWRPVCSWSDASVLYILLTHFSSFLSPVERLL